MMLRGFGCLALALVSGLASPLAAQAPSAVGKVAERKIGGAVSMHRASAAIFVEIADGRVATMRAWGRLGDKSNTPVSTDTTPWPIASITKTMTAVAIAQLIDRGAIRSLDDPANTYLKRFKLPDWQSRAITLRDLLTHRSGFDESNFAIYAPRHGQPYPLSGAAYRAVMPPLVRAPGRWPSYSNFGAAVLGAIVEDVSGRSFADTVARQIFAPLGMRRALLPTAPGNPSGLVIPQDLTDPAHPVAMPTHPDSLQNLPSGGAVASGADMARYMLALLDPSGIRGVLSRAGTDRLFAPLAAVHPALINHAMLFEVQRLGDAVVVHHGGTTEGVWCELYLNRARQSGIFFCLTDWWHGRGIVLPADRPGITIALVSAFLGAPPPSQGSTAQPTNQPGTARSDLARYAGDYVSLRSYEATAARVMALFSPNRVTVVAGRHGLQINGMDGYTEVAPGLFAGGGPEMFAFAPTSGGYILARQFRPDAYRRATLADNAALVASLLFGGLAAIALGGALLWRTDVRFAVVLAAASAASGGALIGALMLPVPGWATLVDGYLAGDARRFDLAAAFGAITVVGGVLAAACALRKGTNVPTARLAGGSAALLGSASCAAALWAMHLLGSAQL